MEALTEDDMQVDTCNRSGKLVSRNTYGCKIVYMWMCMLQMTAASGMNPVSETVILTWVVLSSQSHLCEKKLSN